MKMNPDHNPFVFPIIVFALVIGLVFGFMFSAWIEQSKAAKPFHWPAGDLAITCCK